MKNFVMAATAALIASALLISPAQARHHRHTASSAVSSSCRNNTVREVTAYGIAICVDSRFASNFLSFFSALKSSGARVTSIVCQAYGHAPGSNHVGGGACDVNQRAKNRTIPAMYRAGAMIRAAGLYDGCAFRDCGHVEAMRGLGNYGGRTFAARAHRRVKLASTSRIPAHYQLPAGI